MAFDMESMGRAGLAEPGMRQSGSGVLTPPLLTVIAVLLCLECALFVAFLAGRLDTPRYVAGHLLLCAGTAALGLWRLRPGREAVGRDEAATLLQAAAWSALAGPFGAVIAGALLVPRRAARTGDEVAAAPATTRLELTRQEALHRSLLDSRLRLEGAHTVRPMLEIIIEGTQLEKFDALGLISKHYDPALAPALKRALVDRDGSVRVLAATVMAQQHGTYTKRIGAAQDAAKTAPEVAARWSDLGQAHFDYARCGLLETGRAGAELARAIANLARAVELDPADTLAPSRLEVARRIASEAEETP
jgi:hypothetical protein